MGTSYVRFPFDSFREIARRSPISNIRPTMKESVFVVDLAIDRIVIGRTRNASLTIDSIARFLHLSYNFHERQIRFALGILIIVPGNAWFY